MEKEVTIRTIPQRMLDLYRSNDRSSGRFHPRTERMHTEYQGLNEENFVKHIIGEYGIGAVPILDDNKCWWGAIDIDNHDSDEDIPIGPVDERVIELKLPLILCRSKSGGIHAYAFFDEAQPASRVKTLLNDWAEKIGFPGVEIFPKQAKLSDKSGSKQLGNWINLPYLHGDETNRYAVRMGKRLTISEFIAQAEKSRITTEDLDALTLAEHADAPPCIQRLFAKGAPMGHRNEALYNTVVYLKQKYPTEYEERGMQVNFNMFPKPLAKTEAKRTIVSAGRPDCRYRCSEEPIHSLCDRELCLKRKYGISLDDLGVIDDLDSLPSFANLVKFMSEPVRWEISVDGVVVSNIATPDLLDWRRMREICADRLTRIVPVIKGIEWERILQPLMANARIITAPDDASVSGVIRERLREFAGKTDLLSHGEDTDDRKALLRGLPIVAKMDGGIRCVVFRAQDFINYLKRTKSEELKGINLWFAIKNLGAQHGRLRVGDTIPNVWYIPVEQVMVHEVSDVEFKPEI